MKFFVLLWDETIFAGIDFRVKLNEYDFGWMWQYNWTFYVNLSGLGFVKYLSFYAIEDNGSLACPSAFITYSRI